MLLSVVFCTMSDCTYVATEVHNVPINVQGGCVCGSIFYTNKKNGDCSIFRESRMMYNWTVQV